MESTRDLIINTIKERSCLKRDVYENTIGHFENLKEVLKEFSIELAESVQAFDKRLEVKYEEKGEFECRLTMAGDTLIFYMHSNVFQFDQTHHIWNTSYVKDDPTRGYCGTIRVYNFLADSFRMKRMNDIGYMIARIFINNEDHYLVEGRRQLGYLYNDFVNNVLDKPTWRRILESALLYSLDFDLYVPPYNEVVTTSVSEVNELASSHGMKTGKRFGFQFAAEQRGIIKS